MYGCRNTEIRKAGRLPRVVMILNQIKVVGVSGVSSVRARYGRIWEMGASEKAEGTKGLIMIITISW